MRTDAPFGPDDLAELDERFFAQAAAVVALEDVWDGNWALDVIGLRHDCDAGHSLATAVKMAEWEAARGYRSTYYVLHTSPYWWYPDFPLMLDEIAGHGHEIGIHTNALAEALRTGVDPDVILDEALATLRGYGFKVRGAAGHGDPFCNRDRGPGEPTFANDEQFVECARPKEGAPDRLLTRGNISLRLRPRPLADFGLEYEALALGLPYPFRVSDSGGQWLPPGFDEHAAKFAGLLAAPPEVLAAAEPHVYRPLHMLVHPDWWAGAFAQVGVAA